MNMHEMIEGEIHIDVCGMEVTTAKPVTEEEREAENGVILIG